MSSRSVAYSTLITGLTAGHTRAIQPSWDTPAALLSWIWESSCFEQQAAGCLLNTHCRTHSGNSTILKDCSSGRAALLSRIWESSSLSGESNLLLGESGLLWAAGCLHSVHCRRDTLGTGCWAIQTSWETLIRKYNGLYSTYRVFFLTGTPPKSSKYKKVNLG